MSSSLAKSRNCVFSHLRSLITIQRLNHTLHPPIPPETEMGSGKFEQRVNVSKWRKVDARTLGIRSGLIPESPWIVMRYLRNKGHQVYLVGGCVRDLILKRVPKDYDVITTAKLSEVKKQFHRCIMMGKRFPICQVRIRNSSVEVSSFETVAKTSNGTQALPYQMPRGCDEGDLLLWENSMHRDFTVNSLFFNPFSNKIYDYTSGIADIRSSKLQTVIPAHLSFEEDCARILRGLRIAARLGLSLSKETESAIHKCSSSIKKLDQFRLMLELNYMLSYGAAKPSILLLQRFNLLELFLPFHATFLSNQTNEAPAQNCEMLMKLLLNLDKLLSCDRPAHCTLWIGIFGFHQALVRNPQDGLVIWVFASVLYHGNWKEGLKFARKHANGQVKISPEISGFAEIESDEELEEKVSIFASLVQNSVYSLVRPISAPIHEQKPVKFQPVVPKKQGNEVCQMLEVLVHSLRFYERGRNNSSIDYYLLGQGDQNEIRYVLGEIILRTLSDSIFPNKEEKKKHRTVESFMECPVQDQTADWKNRKLGQTKSFEGTRVENLSSAKRRRHHHNSEQELDVSDLFPVIKEEKRQRQHQQLDEENLKVVKKRQHQQLDEENLKVVKKRQHQQLDEENLKVVKKHKSPKQKTHQANMPEQENPQHDQHENVNKTTTYSSKRMSNIFR